MSPSRPKRLPDEVWSAVLGCISLHELQSMSGVSKTWQAVAFPHLYRTVYISTAEHFYDLANRIESDVDGPLSLRTHIRGLIFDEFEPITRTVDADPLDEDELDRLYIIVPKLSRLRYFSWEMTFFPSMMNIFSTLRAAELEHVSWCVWDEENILEARPEDFLELLQFRNLTHFSLVIGSISESNFYGDFKDPIASLLATSPNLKSLNLEFRCGRGEVVGPL